MAGPGSIHIAAAPTSAPPICAGFVLQRPQIAHETLSSFSHSPRVSSQPNRPNRTLADAQPFHAGTIASARLPTLAIARPLGVRALALPQRARARAFALSARTLCPSKPSDMPTDAENAVQEGNNFLQARHETGLARLTGTVDARQQRALGV